MPLSTPLIANKHRVPVAVVTEAREAGRVDGWTEAVEALDEIWRRTYRDDPRPAVRDAYATLMAVAKERMTNAVGKGGTDGGMR